MHQLLYPEKRWMTDEQVLSWAQDLATDGDIEGDFGDDVWEARFQLEDIGVATFKDPKSTDLSG